jgi:glycosyltransferase involved in cell wall biosynthesis
VLHVITPYGRTAGSSRVRVFEWLDRLDAPRVISSYIGQRDASPLRVARHPAAVVAAERRLRRMAAAGPQRLLLHREASPVSRGGLEDALLSSSAFGVYDFDDALQWDTGEDSRLRRLAPKAAKALIAVSRADRVIAGNPVLAEWASQHNRDVVVIPSCVSVDAYRGKTDYHVSSPPRLGWIGSRHNEAYLRSLAPVLRELHRRTGARLTLIGTSQRTLGDLEELIDRTAWSEAGQYSQLAELDLGIAPVPDRPYERGKSGYKLLQYGAAGVPLVASPVGVNREILSRFRMPGPEQVADWLDAIVDLLNRPVADREALGRAARETTRAHYSYDAWLPRWRQAVGVDE